jgi:hypothetical protein
VLLQREDTFLSYIRQLYYSTRATARALIPTNRERGLARREKERIILLKDHGFQERITLDA